MTPQEKELIQGVFQRLAQGAAVPKDPEAVLLIRQLGAAQPEALYGLVQAVVVQEIGLTQAQQRIADLQRQLEQVRSPAAPAAGGFLGGATPWGGGSVPRTAAVPPPAWAQSAAPTAYAPPPAAGPWSGAGGAGGFLRSAATMAAGVAGGTLIAEGLSSLFGGHRGGFGGGFTSGSPWGGQPEEIVENVTVNNTYYGDDAAAPGVADAGYQDAAFDDSSFDGGFDDSSDI
jgi:hypothetical protein